MNENIFVLGMTIFLLAAVLLLVMTLSYTVLKCAEYRTLAQKAMNTRDEAAKAREVWQEDALGRMWAFTRFRESATLGGDIFVTPRQHEERVLFMQEHYSREHAEEKVQLEYYARAKKCIIDRLTLKEWFTESFFIDEKGNHIYSVRYDDAARIDHAARDLKPAVTTSTASGGFPNCAGDPVEMPKYDRFVKPDHVNYRC